MTVFLLAVFLYWLLLALLSTLCILIRAAVFIVILPAKIIYFYLQKAGAYALHAPGYFMTGEE